jgi:excisionase family DNA binding protein
VAGLFLGRKEAARALGLSVRTLDRAVERGDLRHKKHGTRALIPRAEIARFLEELARWATYGSTP